MFLSFIAGIFSSAKNLSTNKTNFMTKPLLYEFQMNPSQMLEVINHYNHKHDITIVLNGITTIGKQIVAENSERYRSELTYYQDKSIRYAYYLHKNPNKSSLLGELPQTLREEARQVFGDGWRQRIGQFSDDQLRTLNAILIKSEKFINVLLDEDTGDNLNQITKFTKKRITDVCLEAKQVKEEIKFIRTGIAISYFPLFIWLRKISRVSIKSYHIKSKGTAKQSSPNGVIWSTAQITIAGA